MRRLPTAWTRAIERPIAVEWRDDLPAQVHGRALRGRMLLDRRLLESVLLEGVLPERQAAGPASAGDQDSATRAALAAIIHELAHFYDRTPQGRLSSDPRLLDLAGWQVSPARFGLRSTTNHFSDRSPDPYELTSPAEFVAVNLEHFLLDPAYACRRPALHRYFADRLQASPPQAECAPGPVYLQPDPEQPPLQQLDATRVYEVDYLLAEGNEQAMSRWGHSMLRLVVCAPERKPGPDCRLDLQHHRVFSFRAFVDDVQVSSWRGLTGSYPSRLFVLPLEQVIDEYTRVELRGLRSVPLRLALGEIDSLLERAARLHWSYDGRYYFVSNNCAVETFKLLHAGVPRLSRLRLASITPKGLLRRLEKAGIADASVLADPAEAARLGYRFPSASTHYQAMFDIARQALGLPQRRADQWLALPPSVRANRLTAADLRTSAALLLLEQAALRRQELLARDELKRQLFRHAPYNPRRAEFRAALHESLRLDGLLSRPATLLPGAGYGLPQAAEREAMAARMHTERAAWQQHGKDIREAARRWLPPNRQDELAATERNVALLGEQLRRLSRQATGMQLSPGR